MNRRPTPAIARHGTEVIGLLQRNQERPLQKLTDEELAALGALGGFAPMLRANVAEQLYVLARLAGMEENRRLGLVGCQCVIGLGRGAQTLVKDCPVHGRPDFDSTAADDDHRADGDSR